MSDKIEKRYDLLYNDVKKLFLETTSGKITMSTVSTLTRYSMELVQTGVAWASMRGSEKKELVMDVVNALFEDLINDDHVVGDIPDELKSTLQVALSVVPSFIDATVDFAKVYINTKHEPNRKKLCCF